MWVSVDLILCIIAVSAYVVDGVSTSRLVHAFSAMSTTLQRVVVAAALLVTFCVLQVRVLLHPVFAFVAANAYMHLQIA